MAMSTLAEWVRSIRDRPIAEQERNTAMVLTVALFTTVALLLTLTQPARPANQTNVPAVKVETTVKRQHASLVREAKQVTRRFLAGYLAYAYGHGRADQITDAAQSLTSSLDATHMLAPPAQRARRPRVISLQSATVDGKLKVAAVVNDGGLVDYQLEVTLAFEDGRLLASGLDGTR
jgi:hypothetical protein